MKPQISIIIPTWNTAQITLKCIKTIQKHLPPGFAQIIIVDNGSTDNTPQIFNKIPDITYIRNLSNLGFSKGNNIGAKQATANTLLFLNSDMELIDYSLVNMVTYYNSHPDIGAIGPRFLNNDLTTQGSVLHPQTPINAFKEFWLGIPAYSKYIPQTKHPISVWSISGGALLISKELFSKINGWDERYFFYGEDLEICRQIRQHSKKIIFYPLCKLVHHHGASGQGLASPLNQWRRQIPSSKIFHGLFEHYLIFLITWLSQKLHLPLTK